MKIAMIGAGRLATQLGRALRAAGHDITVVYSRTERSAATLAAQLACASTTCLDDVPAGADVYILSVTDNALPHVARRIYRVDPAAVYVHTAGSMPLSVLDGARHHAVGYPLQTFSKERDVDFRSIPCFVEASDDEALATVESLFASIADRVVRMTTADRRRLHIAAVFACNFVNHCYDLAATLLQQRGIAFDVLLPLIDETARKVHTMAPRKAQTGPAVRYDTDVLDSHLRMLADDALRHDIYALLSRSIHEYSIHDKL